MKNIFKKFSLFLLIIFLPLVSCGPSTTLTTSTQASEIDYSGNVIIHYYRFDEKYDDWLTWIWPDGKDGGRFLFQTPYEMVNNQKWKVISIDLSKTYETKDWNGVNTANVNFANRTSERLGIIPRNLNGDKDMATDRYIDLNSKGKDNKVNAYIIEGNADIYYKLEDVPQNKIKKASYVSFSTISVEAFVPFTGVKLTDFKFSCDNPDLKLLPDSDVSKSFVAGVSAGIQLATPITEDFIGANCKVKVEGYGEEVIDVSGLYSSKEFNDAFAYDGKLGVTFEETVTTFHLWAPTAKSVVLKLYQNGNGSESPVKHIMIKKEKGVFEKQLQGNLHGTYYTYDVELSGKTNTDVVDPYAVSTGVNGLRGLVVDFDNPAVIPTNWMDVTTPTLDNYNKATIYELHVRDLTMHSTWNGSENNRGKYLGLIEKGTSYQGKPTGFDYIKNLGVSHVQLLPIFDYQSVDETRLNDQAYKNAQYNGIFNWGYDPQNYNAPEGSYSTDPYDGLKRVLELREVSKAYNDAGIGIIMDVVYNHMPNRSTSSFEKILPGYFFRKNNYSGAGDDTASERAMFRKFMIDSTAMWMENYKLSGFRFDLMGLHDYTTMNMINEKLTSINPNSIMLGEGWDMFNGSPDSPNLKKSSMASQINISKMTNIAAFNDGIRDGLKGSVFNANDTGFIQTPNATNTNTVKWGILGTASSDQINKTLVSGTANTDQWSKNPGVSINYVEAHDNLTLYDKLLISAPGKTQEVYQGMQSNALSIILLGQGTPFLHAGGEMLRSKKMPSDFTKNEKMICTIQACYSGDSYNASDKINAIDWSLIVTNNAVVTRVKDLIDIRKKHSIFTTADVGTGNDALGSRLRFLDASNGVIAYTLTKASLSTDEWSKVVVVHNANSSAYQFTLPTGTWKLAFDGNSKVTSSLVTTYSVPAYATIIAYQS